MKIQSRRPRFSIRALLLFTSVVALVLGYRQYVVFRVHAMNDGIKRAEIEMKRRGGHGDDIVAYPIDPRFRSWMDFLLVAPPRMAVCTLDLIHPNEDIILEILSSSGVRSIEYVSWLLLPDSNVPDVNDAEENESDNDDTDAKPPVPKKFRYIASSTLDRLSKFEILDLYCHAPVAAQDMSKFNQIQRLHKLILNGDWLTDEHLKFIQPSDDLRILDLGLPDLSLTKVTEEGLMELIDRLPYPSSLKQFPSDPSTQRLLEYIKKREISNLSKKRR